MKTTEYDFDCNAPWKIDERERVWTACYNWLAKNKKVKFGRITVRYSVCEFLVKSTEWKLYLPYQDTNLQTVLLNTISGVWVEITSVKDLRKQLKLK